MLRDRCVSVVFEDGVEDSFSRRCRSALTTSRLETEEPLVTSETTGNSKDADEHFGMAEVSTSR
jgi:hypothetical protein